MVLRLHQHNIGYTADGITLGEGHRWIPGWTDSFMFSCILKITIAPLQAGLGEGAKSTTAQPELS